MSAKHPSWAGKHFSRLTEAERLAVREHLANLADGQRAGYQQYLINYCGFAKEWFT